jgi:hypothetical protein
LVGSIVSGGGFGITLSGSTQTVDAGKQCERAGLLPAFYVEGCVLTAVFSFQFSV